MIYDKASCTAAKQKINKECPVADVAVRFALCELAWNMRDRADSCDRTARGELYGMEVHTPINSDTLRAFAAEVERIAYLGLPEDEEAEKMRKVGAEMERMVQGGETLDGILREMFRPPAGMSESAQHAVYEYACRIDAAINRKGGAA
jgi:hypothetical protein